MGGMDLHRPGWLAQRAVLAVTLMIGFYGLAITVTGLLLWMPYAEYRYLRRVDLRVALGCVGAAAMIALSLVPRRDRFEPPGPPRDERTEPHLFSFIREVAVATRQQMPSEVYLLGDLNAWVAQRGGTMGFGSRRIMGIGLPLLESLPPAELRAVLAHEFGHYADHDVKLGPWIHVTRGAIARTVEGLDDSWVAGPFKWYGHLFMRLTQAVSRHQELVADQTSAAVAGAEVAARALRRVSTSAPAYALYWQHDLLPVLQAGYLPPVAQGFRRFLRTESYGRVRDAVEAAEQERPSDLLDTHPPLRERLAALGHVDVACPESSDAEASTALLSDSDAYARRLMQPALGEDGVNALRPVAWEEVGRVVYATQWRHFVAHHVSFLAPLTIETLPAGRDALLHFAKPIRIPGGIENSQRVAFAVALLGAAVATVLVDHGWQPDGLPGEDLTLRKEGRTFAPFSALAALSTGAIGAPQWAALCGELGLSGGLVPAGVPPVPAPATDPAPATRRRRRSW